MLTDEEWGILLDYEQNRNLLMPSYNDMVDDITNLAVTRLPVPVEDPVKVLSLGTFIGLDAKRVCDELSVRGYEVDLYCVDIRRGALNESKSRLEGRKGIRSVTAFERDYTIEGWEEGIPEVDIAFSNFSTGGIPDKRKFYEDVHNLLRPGSPLIMGVSVYLGDEEKHERANRKFVEEVKSRIDERLGRITSHEELGEIFDRWFGRDWYGRHESQRHTREEKLNWLRDAGYDRVGISSEYFDGIFSVIYGIKFFPKSSQYSKLEKYNPYSREDHRHQLFRK